ncbi:MAG: cardiolipin synthase [Lachnospiraceae bacterium]|nr:cardiolipin synthase [Lachnospiraceae bacterium]
MKKLIRAAFKMVFSRIMVIALLLILQIGILFAGFEWLGQYMSYVMGGFTTLSVLLVIYIINKEDDPAYKLVWMIPVCGIPVFGALLYLFVELNLGGWSLRKRLQTVLMESVPYLQTPEEVKEDMREEEPGFSNLAAYLQKNCGYSAFENTDVMYFPLGEDKYRQLLVDLKTAKHFIFLEYFIIEKGKMWDSILEVLKQKASEGVEIRLMYDGMCSLVNLPRRYPQELTAQGIQTRVFAPIRPMLSTAQNNRDHRKIVSIDGRIAYTGGVNLADEYINEKARFGHWKDTAVRLEGDGAQGLTMMFLQNWNMMSLKSGSYEPYMLRSVDGTCRVDAAECVSKTEKEKKGFVIPFGDAPGDKEAVGENVYMDMLYTAKRYVHITTPYLIIDGEMERALIYAAKRGVDVRIILPHIPDKKYAFYIARTYYPLLLNAGVKLYEYEPGFIHAKSFVSDDEKAVVGTINLDYRSLYLHFECGVYMYHNPVVEDIERDYQETLAKCIPVDMEYYKRINGLSKLAGRVLRLFAPLM